MQTIGIVLVAIFGVIFVGLVLYLLIDNLRTGELAMGRTKPLTGSPSSPAATVSSASPLRWAPGCSATCGTPWFLGSLIGACYQRTRTVQEPAGLTAAPIQQDCQDRQVDPRV